MMTAAKKNKRMTRRLRLALTWTAEVWGWLAKNPGRYKGDFPRWSEYLAALSKAKYHNINRSNLECPYAHCPCCVYADHVASENGAMCSCCPLGSVFWSGEKTGGTCIDKRSPYHRWYSSNFLDTAAAAEIRDRALELLAAGG